MHLLALTGIKASPIFDERSPARAEALRLRFENWPVLIAIFRNTRLGRFARDLYMNFYFDVIGHFGAHKILYKSLYKGPYAAKRLDDLRVPRGNRLEALHGDRQDQHGIRINDQWRICFKWGMAKRGTSRLPTIIEEQGHDHQA